MTTPRLMAVLLLLWLASGSAKSQTVALAEPVADNQGLVAFRITELIRVEGYWEKPLRVDQLIYPLRPEKALPLGRFGESVLIVFSKPGELSQWQGLNVHNGCIPALNGRSVEDLLVQIAKMPPPNMGPNDVIKGTPATAPTSEAEFAICPICKKRHIRVK